MPAYRAQAELTGLAGSPWLSTFYFDSAFMATPGAAVATVANFFDALDPLMSNSVDWATLPEVVRYTTPDTITDFFATEQIFGGGERAEDPLPTQTQGLIRWRTDTIVNNRRVLGHTYVPGATEVSSGIDGMPIPSYVTVLQNAADILVTSSLMIASRVGNVFAPVTSRDIWSNWAVLRGRRD